MKRMKNFDNYSRSTKRRILISSRRNFNDEFESSDSSDGEFNVHNDQIRNPGNNVFVHDRDYENHDYNVDAHINDDDFPGINNINNTESDENDTSDVDDNDDNSEDEFYDTSEEVNNIYENISESSNYAASDTSVDDFESEDTERELEDTDDGFDFEAEAEAEEDPPLYRGSFITVSESLLSILTLVLRFSISGVLLASILQLIALHCPPQNQCRQTLYTFKKYFEKQQTPLSRHYYCGNCCRSLDGEYDQCPACELSTDNKYFITMSIISQLNALYRRPGFRNKLQHRFTRIKDNSENIEDVYDGEVYKELSQPGQILADRNNISFMWYTDGVPVFKSSKFSFWPVYLVINELPYNERFKKENLILMGLWFGEETPITNLFLRPTYDEVVQLRDGVDFELPENRETVKVKGIIICGTCDLPAKAKFLNMKQYNGKFGCHKCKTPGERIGKIQVYPYRRNLRLRTEQETLRHAEMANNRKPVCGVKGPTIISSLVYKWITTTAIDPMHCVFIGMMKFLLNLWFNPKFADEPFSIYEMVDVVDARIRNLCPPKYVQRRPRSIKDHLKHWKSSELRNFFFSFSIPILSDILNKEYFDHFQLLVDGIFLLSQKSISMDMIKNASRALDEFVSRFENLYGRRYMTSNLHSLRHLGDGVLKLGPLFVYSCTGFEDINGKLKTLVHGSKCAQLQIYYGASLFLNTFTLHSELLVAGSKAHEFCKNLLSPTKQMKLHTIDNTTSICGALSKLVIPDDIMQVITNQNIEGQKFVIFKKLFKDNIVYSSQIYQRSKLTNSRCVKYLKNNERRFGIIEFFIRVTNCVCQYVCQCEAHHYAIIKICQTEKAFPTSIIPGINIAFIHKINITNEIEIIHVNALKTVVFLVEANNIKYFSEPANTFEIE